MYTVNEKSNQPAHPRSLIRVFVVRMKKFPNIKYIENTVDSRYLELQGTLWNSSRYPYFDISDLRTQENN